MLRVVLGLSLAVLAVGKGRLSINHQNSKCPTEAACGDERADAPSHSAVVTVKAASKHQEICVAGVPAGFENWKVDAWTIACGVGSASVCVNPDVYASIRVFCDDSLDLGRCNTSHAHIDFKLTTHKTDYCAPEVCRNDRDFAVLCDSESVEEACRDSAGTRAVCRGTCSLFGVKYELCGPRPLCENDHAAWSFACEHVGQTQCESPRIRATCKKECSLLGVRYQRCIGGPCALRLDELSGLIGEFRPQCDADGFYRSMQCHGSTGDCWCADPLGNELDGTRRTASEPRPECDPSPSPAPSPLPEDPEEGDDAADTEVDHDDDDKAQKHTSLPVSPAHGAVALVSVCVLVAGFSKFAGRRRQALAAQDDAATADAL